MLRSELLNAPALRHGFFTREGGVSGGIYASLNCGPGSGDDPEAVAENRRRVLLGMGAEHLCTLYQIHSASVITVTEPWKQGEAPQADATVTSIPGIALGILTADCAPVLFADAETRVVGAAHAGWKGALGGVLEATLEAMEKLGADRRRVVAAVGPCIHQESYEVSGDFRTQFLQQTEANAHWFIPSKRPGHFLFNLPRYVETRLKKSGIAQVDVLPRDTYADAQRFFSFRRATHQGEKHYGRQISTIRLS